MSGRRLMVSVGVLAATLVGITVGCGGESEPEQINPSPQSRELEVYLQEIRVPFEKWGSAIERLYATRPQDPTPPQWVEEVRAFRDADLELAVAMANIRPPDRLTTAHVKVADAFDRYGRNCDEAAEIYRHQCLWPHSAAESRAHSAEIDELLEFNDEVNRRMKEYSLVLFAEARRLGVPWPDWWAEVADQVKEPSPGAGPSFDS